MFPAGTPTVTLTGTLPGAAVGTPFAGRVVLTPSAVLIDADRNVIYPGGGRVDFDEDGAFEVELLPNDAAGIEPDGWKWEVDVQPLRGRRITFWADIHGADGATIHLADLVPIPAPGGGPGPGPAGESAYEVAVDEGFDGDVTEWLASLIGPAGADGTDGADGQDGAKGDKGDAGDPATNLVQSVNGDIGVVVLTASDVGADPAGAAAAAQSAAVATAATDATGKVTAHNASTTSVHGIANTAALETTTGAQTKATAAQTAATTAAATDATGKVATHAGAADPHGDRAWTSGLFAPLSDTRLTNARTPTAHAATHAAAGADPVTLTQAQITGLEAALSLLAQLTGATFTGPIVINGADLTIQGAGKAYRFRRGGGSLDLEGTGSDLIVSIWSGTNFNGDQHSYDRYSADALNVQHAGRREYVSSLYGVTVHVIDPDRNQLGFFGAPPVGQPTVSGSWSDGTAQTSLAAALDALGLINDTTTP